MTHAIISADVVHYLRGNRWLVQNGYLPKYHAVLCDPPYGLAFMGKHWDDLGPIDFQAWVTEWATLLLDYVYPGGVLMAFGGTRTYHRLAAGLEDAGWEIADVIAWTYGSGFPKSHDISKALDREAGAQREVVGEWRTGFAGTLGGKATYSGLTSEDVRRTTAPATPLAARWSGYGTALKPAYEPCVVARAPRGNRTYAGLAREFGTGALNVDGGRIDVSADDPNKRRDTGGYASGKSLASVPNAPYNKTREATLQTGRWPANFALVCTCESDDHAADCPVRVLDSMTSERTAKPTGAGDVRGNSRMFNGLKTSATNAIDDNGGTAARFFYTAKASAWEREAGLMGFARGATPPGHNLSTNACARCGKRVKANGSGDKCQCGDLRETVKVSDRANVHPTVKPIKLAEYLARLLLPPELDEPRRLLVPFAGSGSEMIGALLAGWDDVTGIEREAEYAAIARARVGWWAQFGTYDEARKADERARRAKPATAGRRDRDDFTGLNYEVLTCPIHGATAPKKGGGVRTYACGCALVYGKRAAAPIPLPVVVEDEKPAQLGLFEEEAS